MLRSFHRLIEAAGVPDLAVHAARRRSVICCTWLLAETGGAGVRGRDTGSDLRGRYWDRTSDLLGVNEALSR